jgi:hypothetical protein
MIIDMGGGTVDMTIHKVDTAGDTVSLSELTHRECETEVRLRNPNSYVSACLLSMSLGQEYCTTSVTLSGRCSVCRKDTMHCSAVLVNDPL